MQVIGGVTHYVRSRWPEWVLAFTLLGQCLLLITGRNLHDNQVYSVLRQVIDMRDAAGMALIVAIIWLGALTLNGTFIAFRRISPWIRVLTATATSLYWTVWAVTLWQAAKDFTSLAWFNNAALATMAAMCVFTAAREVAHADKKAQQWKVIRARTGGR